MKYVHMMTLIYTKNNIKELYNKIKEVVDVKESNISSDIANITTTSGMIITIRHLTENCRGYKRNVILYDGKFTRDEMERMRWNLIPNGLFKKLSINHFK